MHPSSGKRIRFIFYMSIVLLSAALLLSACENAADGLPPVPSVPEPTKEIVEIPVPVPAVEIDDVLFSAETPRLVLTGLDVDEATMEEVLPRFKHLASLDLRGTAVSHEYAQSLTERYPETEIFWDVLLFDMLPFQLAEVFRPIPILHREHQLAVRAVFRHLHFDPYHVSLSPFVSYLVHLMDSIG